MYFVSDSSDCSSLLNSFTTWQDMLDRLLSSGSSCRYVTGCWDWCWKEAYFMSRMELYVGSSDMIEWDNYRGFTFATYLESAIEADVVSLFMKLSWCLPGSE